MVDILGDPQVRLVAFSAIVLVVAFAIVQLFDRLVVRVAEQALKVAKGRLTSARRFFSLLVYTVAAIVILWNLNVDITGLLAGLGIGALIIGFALKDIIENWIAGILVIGGRVFRMGDVIRVDNLTGVVTDMSLRTTTLKTYDRNEIILPNASLLKSNIVNLTSGKRETVASVVFAIDYTFDPKDAKALIAGVLREHPDVVVDEARRREIRFVVRVREWNVEVETLFWIHEPDQEEFIKSRITELVKRRFEDAGILPPVPAALRQQYLERRKVGGA